MGVQLHIPYRNPYNLRFSRGAGGPDPLSPPLDLHLIRGLQAHDSTSRVISSAPGNTSCVLMRRRLTCTVCLCKKITPDPRVQDERAESSLTCQIMNR